MEHIWTTISDLFVFFFMIFAGSIVWLISRKVLFKIIKSSRVVEAISIILALSIGVIIINNYLLK